MKKGDLVLVDFLDHVSSTSGISELIKCAALGWIVDLNKQRIIISPWVANRSLSDPNNDTYTLMRHKGMKITVLRKAKL
jgi:hypothetical protein